MDEYARSYGHEPPDNWILMVHPNNTSEFYTFDDPSNMWCCEERFHIRDELGAEVAEPPHNVDAQRLPGD
jgi:hypothetical protein